MLLTLDATESEARAEPVVTPDPRPVTGIDGKTYTRPEPRTTPAPVDEVADALAEFPDLAYYADTWSPREVVLAAGGLRRYRERGELEVRLDSLRRSIALDQSKRNGTYVPATVVPATCPTGGQTIKENLT